MIKKKFKPFVVPVFYCLAIVMFVISMYFIGRIVNNVLFEGDDDLQYVDQEIFDQEQNIPVVGEEELIVRPYTSDKVVIAKNYYDYEGDAKSQQNSLIYYENTYMQNSGIDYKADEKFDVVSILDGTVVSVKEDNILGNVVEIRHNNELISIYQSLSDVKVKENDTVKQGQIIAKSGSSNINKELNDHLHFELFHKGKVVNPENYYNKKIEEL